MKRLIALICALSALLVCSCTASKEWSKAGWDDSSWNDRQDMLDSLLDTVDFTGMTRDEVVSMLGNDTFIDTGFVVRDKTDTNSVYDFGEDKSAKGSNIALVIEFDEDGVVSGYHVSRYSQ